MKIDGYKERECYFCREKGHIKRNCKKFMEHIKNKELGNKGSIKTTRLNKMYPNCFDYFPWLINSGATSHMSNDKSVLVTLTKALKDI